MKRPQKLSSLLDEIVHSLVKSFGPEMVAEAIKKASTETAALRETSIASTKRRSSRAPNPTIIELLEGIRAKEPDRYQVLTSFYDRLKSRNVLADSQDIRQFAQIVGLKHIDGTSRKDMINALIRSLVSVDMDILRYGLSQADNISDEQRKMGFSVLTDKLISNT